MQYILSEEEYKALTQQRQHEIKLSKDKLQKLCTKIANEMPIHFWGRKEAEPWGCYLDAKDEWYCDECPVQDICPHPSKDWSQ